MGAGGQRKMARPTQGPILKSSHVYSEAETIRIEIACPGGEKTIAVPLANPKPIQEYDLANMIQEYDLGI